MNAPTATEKLAGILAIPAARAAIMRASLGDEDCYASVALALVEHVTARPDFADRGVGYVVTRARWIATDYWRKAAREMSRHEECRDASGDVDAFLDSLPDCAPGTEAAAIARVAIDEICEVLPGSQSIIARALSEGFTKTDAAEMAGVSRSNASHMMRRIARVLQESK